jgi:23S rRNA (cytosine1962-C5)-methyltransferase
LRERERDQYQQKLDQRTMLLRVTDPRSDPVPSMLNSPSPPPLNRFILFEDQDLLVTEKPAGLNTHAPSPFAGEGFYDWLRHREPRWSSLAIVHRLDKETSGVLVFGKTPLANRSLTEQFTRHGIRKKYLFLAGHRPDQEEIVAVSALVRTGDKYVSRPLHAGAERAETRFRVVGSHAGNTLVEAEPVTGKTHQIRVHAAEHGFPIIGDVLYGGAPGPRVLLHAGELTLRHPATGEPMTFQSSVAFGANHRQQLRAAIIEAPKTNAFRLVHGASDGWPGWYVDRLGDFVLSQAEADCSEKQRAYLEALSDVAGVYHKRLERRIGRAAAGEVSPQFVFGKPAPERFTVKENGVLFELSFQEGYSAGLFLDQRDNRRRFLVNHVAAAFPLFEGGAGGREVLNTFAYTCGFSVCAALAGARVTSLDLSRKYLEWGKRNFTLNGLDAAAHDFIFGDAFDWLRRLEKKHRLFDAIVLDPPTFSQSKQQGVFRAEKDYGRLVTAALPLLKPKGILMASSNAGAFAPEDFLEVIAGAFARSGRRVIQQHYVPQPPDFPISRGEPGYLKTVWLRADGAAGSKPRKR